MPIRVLAEDVAAKIAAGEVIERPVSVIKELVENALDAGATDIRVEIREGGQRLMRVADNGSGIPAAEVEVAFQRHATSKVRAAEDLFHIHTLGFRGEALPSIAAVSRVTLVTRTRGETVGTRLRLDAGRVVERAGIGAPAGTVVTVENLFYNMPARLKFLKSTLAEAGQISTLLQHLAMAYPDRRFSLVSDGRTVFQHAGGTLREALASIYGVDTAQQMIEVGDRGGEKDREVEFVPDPDLFQDDGVGDERDQAGRPQGAPLQDDEASINVYGFVAPPSMSKANRAHMTFIVNGRWVQDRSLNVAVTEAYHTLLMVGRFPVSVLHISLPPEEVDVNVHPAKAEVRFRDSRAVFSAVQQAARQALLRFAPIPQVGGVTGGEWTPQCQPVTNGAWGSGAWALWPSFPMGEDGGEGVETPEVQPAPAMPFQPTLPPLAPAGANRLPPLRVLGQVNQAFIICEGPDGLYLIDQHAAHERILYEQFLHARAQQAVASQPLLEPLPLHLEPGEGAVMAEQMETLNRLGFGLEPFGPGTVLVRAVPAALTRADPTRALRDILALVGEGRRNPLETDAEAATLRAVCKTAAIKAGQTLSTAEMQALIQQLEAAQSPRTCPHGRPTVIHLSAGFIAREFGRV